MKQRLIVEQFDPFRTKPGGIDTCIRGMVKYAPDDVELWIAGIDAVGDKELRSWKKIELSGRTVNFMAVTRLDNANLHRMVPHSAKLLTRLLLTKFPVSYAEVQTHRVNAAILTAIRFRSSKGVLLIHSSGTANLRTGSKSFFRFAPALYRVVEYIAVRSSAKVVVFSRDGAGRLARRFSQVEFSPTWFDPDQFGLAADSAAKTRILWACRIEPAKDPKLAIEALATTPKQYTLTVAGDGTMRGAMVEEVARLSISERVNFVGSVAKEDMGELMRAHGVLLMTSVFEGFSRSIVEALASGLPVITTDGGDPNGLIIDGVNGARFEYAHELTEALRRVEKIDPAKCRESVSDLRADAVVTKVYA